uniref:Uncharacterized protein n=1 Tax=Salmo trutta TaxID=8032 RepID=A0A674D8P2_SALTR
RARLQSKFQLNLLTDAMAVATKKRAAANQKTAAKAALVHTCPVRCTFGMYCIKHPTSPMFPILVDVWA